MTDAAISHDLMGGKLHVYKRPGSHVWQCSAYEAGKNRRVSTREKSLAHAKQFAEDWYLELRGKLRSGELKAGKTFKEAAAQFEREYEIITEGQRNARDVADQKRRLKIHLIPFFGHMHLSEITSGHVQEYRIHRREKAVALRGKPPARNTMRQEIVCLRQTLKTAMRHGWLQYLPDLSEPYKNSDKILHRAWFSRKSTASSTKPPAAGRAIQNGNALNGRANSFMILYSSWPTPACGLTKPTALNIGT